MTLDQIRTIAEAFYAGKPPLASPSEATWRQAVRAFILLVEHDDDIIDPKAVERLCLTGNAKAPNAV
jgi:hypothetical protein